MQDPAFVKDAFAKIADRYVSTNHVLSVGTDILWRKRVGRIVKSWAPQRVLDMATGTGDLALEIQKQCPDAYVMAADFTPEMLAHADRRGVTHTMVADGMDMPFEDSEYDVLTVAFGLRNMEDWGTALREMSRVLKPGGQLLVLDFSLPDNILAKPYGFYLNKVLPKIAGVLTGERGAFEYLAGTIERFPSGRKMQDFIEENGFQNATWTPLSGGIAAIYTAEAKI